MKFYSVYRCCIYDGVFYKDHSLIPAENLSDAIMEARKSIAGEEIVSIRVWLNNNLVYESNV